MGMRVSSEIEVGDKDPDAETARDRGETRRSSPETQR